MGLPSLLSSSDKAPSNRSKLSLSPSVSSSASTSASASASASVFAPSSAIEADLPSDCIHDEAQLPCIPPERPNLRELNSCLEVLAVVFPDIQIEVFRELLVSFDGESRLALVADALLKNRVAWVKGRWKIAENGDGNNNSSSNGNTGSNSSNSSNSNSKGDGEAPAVPRADIFRSAEYKQAAQALALQEFKGLSKSTITAVLAESNYSYLHARQTLVTLSSKSWRFALSSIFMRRKPVVAHDLDTHPLVRWRPIGQPFAIPTIRSTGNAELDRELYEALILPIKQRKREEREAQDHELAVQLNNREADEAGAVHECACCFTSGPFEEFTHCNRDAHMICFRCVQHSIKEALFGQGWQSSIIPETGTLKCMAVDRDECQGSIPTDHVRRAMLEEEKGAEMLDRMEQRLAEHSLLASGLPLVRCPFCNYVEIDDIYTPPREMHMRMKLTGLYSLLFLAFCAAPVVLALPFALISAVMCLVFSPTFSATRAQISSEWSQAMSRHRRRRRGLQFSCQNPQCRRVSCLSCSKAWTDIHVCNESSLVALRTQVEQAMSMAIKRVCPRCNTSFVKNAGCNKLTCPCGYKMCYVCRADLGEEGYRHFCEHFRPDGDPRACMECDKCNLWELEDTDRVLQEARREAEGKWREAEKRDLSTQEKAFLETGIASRGAGVTMEHVLSMGRLPSWSEFFDVVIETMFV